MEMNNHMVVTRLPMRGVTGYEPASDNEQTIIVMASEK
jgi:hypothetical protein